MGDGQQLSVTRIFATLQGEGPFAGQPAVFVRLGGCNLACDFCDTEFETFSDWFLRDILAEVKRLAGSPRLRDLIVVTGGEPFRQPIGPLCEALLEAGFRVQIETNGTLYRPVPEAVNIVCSPKNPNNGYAPLRPDLLEHTNAIKFLLSCHDDRYRSVPDVGQSEHAVPVYVQPMDEGDAVKNAANMAYAASMAQAGGYRLSLQLHKWLGIE